VFRAIKLHGIAKNKIDNSWFVLWFILPLKLTVMKFRKFFGSNVPMRSIFQTFTIHHLLNECFMAITYNSMTDRHDLFENILKMSRHGRDWSETFIKRWVTVRDFHVLHQRFDHKKWVFGLDLDWKPKIYPNPRNPKSDFLGGF
jgi:hypothetical protein